MAGAEAIACTSSAAKMERLKTLGADHVINTSEQDFVAATFERYGKPSRRGADVQKGVDVVVNYTGGDTWVKSMRCLKVGGRLLTCGATAGFDPKEDIRFIWTFELKVLGSNGWARDDIHKLLNLVRTGKLKVPIDRSYRLEETVEAMRVMEDRELFGKIVVTP